MTVLNKTLTRDKERAIQTALRNKYKDEDEYPYIFEIDEDKSEAYFEIWDDGVYKVFAIKYTLNSDATVATLIGEETEVILQSEYKTISKSKNIEKMLSDDKRQALREKLKEIDQSVSFVCDYDEENKVVYFEQYVDDGWSMFKAPYTASADYSKITIGDWTPIEVKYTTEYVEKSKEDSIVEKVIAGITKYFGGTTKSNPVIITKQFEDEQMIEVAPMYIHPDEIDGHGDAYATPEEVYKMVDNFNEALKDGYVTANKFHNESTDEFKILKAWVNECDCMIGENLVKEGQPIVKVQYLNKDAWQKRKSGEYGGYSIGCKAEVEIVE